MIEMVSPWIRDEHAVDPAKQMRTVRVDGYLFTLHNVVGAGWPMSIRPAFEGSSIFTVNVADWEDWDDVEAKAREYLAGR